MLANLTTLVVSTNAWARFETASVYRKALARARAELQSYRPHELEGELHISTSDIEPLAREEARRQTDLYLARRPARRPVAHATAAHLEPLGA